MLRSMRALCIFRCNPSRWHSSRNHWLACLSGQNEVKTKRDGAIKIVLRLVTAFECVTQCAGFIRDSQLNFLSCLLHNRQVHIAFLNHLSRDLELLDPLLAGKLVHQVEHKFFQNHTKTARSDLAEHGFFGDAA